MGCAICLDDFSQADGEAKRATALTCGHIFHHDCLQTWFYGATNADKHRPCHHQRCPLCAGATDPTKMVRLFPSDGDDLDKYLSGQQRWEWDRLQGEDANDHRNLRQLLADLMDFNTAVQSYVMAAHGVKCEIMIKSGVKVRKLFVDLAKDMQPDLKDALMRSIDSLDNAAACFSTMFNDLSRRCRNNRKLQADLLKEKESVRKLTDEANIMTNIAAAKMREVEEKSKEVGQRMDLAVATEQRITDMFMRTQAAKDDLNAREQNLSSQRRKMELETNLKLSNMKNNMETALMDMAQKMNQALIKSAEAEKERQAAHNKSCQLAEQLQQMQQRFKGRKLGAGPAPLSAVVGDVEAMQRRIKALEARNKSMEEQLRMANIATPEHRLARHSPRRNDASSIDLTRSSSPIGHDLDSFPATPLDGVDAASQASASTVAATAGSSPSVQRKGNKRARASLSVEPERLDDEMDEALFPMPGFGALQMTDQRVNRPVLEHRLAQGSGPAKAVEPGPSLLFLKAAAAALDGGASTIDASQGKNIARKRGDHNQNAKTRKRVSTPAAPGGSTSGVSGTSNSGTSSSPNNNVNYEWLKKPNGIALGPKRRSKAS
ncbi:hypothetical protein EX895_003074 [Sporisorium graminicola]|uniref:RING-type domain-containing protein n=1 Tax=Sporisorium graminicola TaxID=280036 RepID=A0A4U7KX08_9BASI|nr:hypothetical protein EX895_003074 [Sporisorium graminicola]TKY87978.1 hypothetical protein EX895_003074 [Sporisorium graminicola]